MYVQYTISTRLHVVKFRDRKRISQLLARVKAYCCTRSVQACRVWGAQDNKIYAAARGRPTTAAVWDFRLHNCCVLVLLGCVFGPIPYMCRLSTRYGVCLCVHGYGSAGTHDSDLHLSLSLLSTEPRCGQTKVFGQKRIGTHVFSPLAERVIKKVPLKYQRLLPLSRVFCPLTHTCTRSPLHIVPSTHRHPSEARAVNA